MCGPSGPGGTTLWRRSEDILEEAREAKDRKTALDAIRAAVNIMAEARQYLELRGELIGELPSMANAAANVRWSCGC